MSKHLYFPKKVKDTKDYIGAYMISCKFFYQLMVTVIKETLDWYLPLSKMKED